MNVLSNVFNWIILSSVTTSILICIIIPVKQIFKNKLSPDRHYYIWILLLLMLILPYAPESPLSVYNVLDPAKGA